VAASRAWPKVWQYLGCLSFRNSYIEASEKIRINHNAPLDALSNFAIVSLWIEPWSELEISSSVLGISAWIKIPNDKYITVTNNDVSDPSFSDLFNDETTYAVDGGGNTYNFTFTKPDNWLDSDLTKFNLGSDKGPIWAQ